MLTIRAMARMGPWLLDRIERLDEGYERCQRCKTKIKWIWVMEKQTEPKQLWRIGSECGPQLEDMSLQLWETVAKPFKTCIPHMRKLDRLLICERDFPHLCPRSYQLGWAAQQVFRYAAGSLSVRDRKVLGMQVSRNEKTYVAAVRNLFAAQRKAAAKAADSLPTNAHH